eukprot:g4945.t1
MGLSTQCLQGEPRPPTRILMNIAMAISDLGEHAAAFQLARAMHDSSDRTDADVAMLAASLAKQVGSNAYCESVAERLIETEQDTHAQIFGLLAACQYRQGKPEAARQTHRRAVEFGSYPSKNPKQPGGSAHWSSRLGKAHPVWSRDMFLRVTNGQKIVNFLDELEHNSTDSTIREELEAWEELHEQQGGANLWAQEHQNLVDVAGNWNELYLYRDGTFNEACFMHFPRTCSMLKRYRALFHPSGHIKLSEIAPGSHVWPHSGGTNTKLRGHFGVFVGEHARMHARLTVNGKDIGWETGRAFVLDDTFEHSVNYPSNEDGSLSTKEEKRLVLLFDMFHPRLKKRSRIRMRRKAQRVKFERDTNG